MRARLFTAAGAGVAAALAIASFPASAADTTIAAGASSWTPSAVTIKTGDTVTWTNSGGVHNVCVQKPGNTGATCDEFRNSDPIDTWTSVSHVFTTAGTYAFYCEAHKTYGMTGTITVEAASTGTSTTPPPDTMPTDTTTVPTQTEGTSLPADTTAPAFTGKPKRRSSRRSLVLQVGSSEPATLRTTVFRRPPRGRSYSRVSEASIRIKQGKNVVTLLRKASGSLRSGSYRVKLQLVDEVGNKSPTRTLAFKLA